MPLLLPSEPPAFSILNPDARSPLVLACDHASNRIPASLDSLGLTAEQLSTHIAWDIGVARVAEQLSELLDATLVRQNYSRLVIDCNRPLEAPDSIAPRSEAVEIVANVGLDAVQIEARRREIFAPYHSALREVLNTRPATRLLALHSFTPVYHGVARPWHTGLLFLRDRRLGQSLLSRLRSDARLHVGENEPYAMDDASDYTLIEHGERRGIEHAGIEIRQDLIGDAAGQHAWALRLATHLRTLPDP